MRVGEALTLRGDLQKRIAQLARRIEASAITQEGDAPPEDADALLEELGTMSEQLQRYITRINLTNAASHLPDGRSITAALAERDVLALRQDVLRATAEAVAQAQTRYSRSEIRLTRHVDAGRVRREIDELAKRRRELDIAIQEHNWTTELSDDTSR